MRVFALIPLFLSVLTHFSRSEGSIRIHADGAAVAAFLSSQHRALCSKFYELNSTLIPRCPVNAIFPISVTIELARFPLEERNFVIVRVVERWLYIAWLFSIERRTRRRNDAKLENGRSRIEEACIQSRERISSCIEAYYRREQRGIIKRIGALDKKGYDANRTPGPANNADIAILLERFHR